MLLSGAAEPFGPTMEALLFAAARSDHVEQVIRPAVERGAIVLCDRFLDSSRVYQGVTGDLDPRFMAALERVAINGMMPDLTLILDLDPAEGLRRARHGAGSDAADRFEKETLAIHQRRREAFLAIASAEPERCVSIDALAPMPELTWRMSSPWQPFSQQLGCAHPRRRNAMPRRRPAMIFERLAPEQYDTSTACPNRRKSPRLVGHGAGAPHARRRLPGRQAAARPAVRRPARHRQGDARVSPGAPPPQHPTPATPRRARRCRSGIVAVSPDRHRRASLGPAPDPAGQRQDQELQVGVTVDEIRKVNRFLSMTAHDGGYRVVIVDPADDMNANAANALLKNLEEPPRARSSC